MLSRLQLESDIAWLLIILTDAHTTVGARLRPNKETAAGLSNCTQVHISQVMRPSIKALSMAADRFWVSQGRCWGGWGP